MQSFFIGVGSVVASLLPFLLAKAGVGNTAGPGEVPDTVRYAFYFGGVVLLAAVAWTVLRTREYPPEQLRAWDQAPPLVQRHSDPRQAWRPALAWLAAGAVAIALIAWFALDKQLYILAGLIAGYGAALLIRTRLGGNGAFTSIVDDLRDMPAAMRQLAVVQFFSWFGLFAMWLFATAAVTSVHFGSSDPMSAAYNEGANWVGVLFAAYNGFAALAAMLIPWMVRLMGLRVTHLVNVGLGGIGLMSFVVIRDPQWLLLSMIGLGFAWASILSLPYALLSDSLPAAKMGVFMGIFNFFIVIPQLVAASLLGFLLKTFLGGEPVQALVIGGISLIVAGLCVLRVRDPTAEPAIASRQETG
jgi:maltose/moltooligosaccharide transporter